MRLYAGHRYSAAIRLGFFERLISNDTIAGKLMDAGFVRVSVVGSGRDRVATATWFKPDQDVDLPDQIVPSTVQDVT